MKQLRLCFLCLTLLACGGGSRPVRVEQPPPAGANAPASVQGLYEAGRDSDVVNRAAAPSVGSDDVWFGAQSLLRVGQRAEASEQFRRLRDTAASDAFRRAADVALARMSSQPDALSMAQEAAMAFPNDPFVQFEAGVTMALQGELAAAAQAFDAALNASPMFAYAYYQAGLAYSRIDRPDLTVARFETFVRLAPMAPERAQVETILRTARGR